MKYDNHNPNRHRLWMVVLVMAFVALWVSIPADPDGQAPHTEEPPAPESQAPHDAFALTPSEPAPGLNLAPGPVEVESAELTPEGAVEVVRGELLVRFAPELGNAGMKAFHAEHGTRVIQRSRHHEVRRIQLPEGMPVARALASIRRDHRIAEAFPNAVIRGADDDDDKVEPGGSDVLSLQWQFGSEGGWSRAHDIVSSAPSVTIAILDSGVAYRDGKNGRVSKAPNLDCTTFVAPYDFINDDPRPHDDHQHGTFLATLIASDVNCGASMRGYAPGASIMPVKVLDATLSGSEMALVEGLYHAADNGADVINMSLTFSQGYRPSSLLRDALDHASHQSVLVAAAGNDHSDHVSFPAGAAHVISVGAFRLGERWWDVRSRLTDYSNTGPGLDFLAPGGDMDVDFNGDGVPDGVVAQTFTPGNRHEFSDWVSSGTSQATAAASAQVALMLEAGAHRDEIRPLMMTSVFPRMGYSEVYGSGFANPHRALLDLQNQNTIAAFPQVSVNLVAALVEDAPGEKSAKVLVQVFDEQGNTMEDAEVFGVWLGNGSGASSCTTDSQGICTVTSGSVADSPAGTRIGFEASVVVPGYRWYESPTPVHPGSSFRMEQSTAESLIETVEAISEPTVLVFGIDPADANNQTTFGSTSLANSYMARNLAPESAVSPVVYTLDDAALLDLTGESEGNTEGVGLGASSLVWDFSPTMFYDFNMTLDVLGGAGLGASSLVYSESWYLTSLDSPSFWFNFGVGLGASSLVWDFSYSFGGLDRDLQRLDGLLGQ